MYLKWSIIDDLLSELNLLFSSILEQINFMNDNWSLEQNGWLELLMFLHKFYFYCNS